MVDIGAVKIYLLARISPNYRTSEGIKVALTETFIGQQYKWLVTDLRPKTVAIDIGAFIGDSAIYLAMFDKIKEIHAYEPFPETYKRAAQNISLSGFGYKIKLYNEGVSNKQCYMKLSESSQVMTPRAKNSLLGKRIRIEALNNLLKGKNNVIIKCDCEGEEHKIFSNGTNLDNVYKIQMEYHHGTGSMTDFLKQSGFRVKKKILNSYSITGGEVGMLYAYR